MDTPENNNAPLSNSTELVIYKEPTIKSMRSVVQGSEELMAWLGGVEIERRKLVLEDSNDVSEELRKHTSLMEQLKIKRVQINDLISSIKALANMGPLDQGVEENFQNLKIKWSAVQKMTEVRFYELSSILYNVENLKSMSVEVSEWLVKLEDKMMKGEEEDVMEVKREIDQYGHHVTGYQNMSQKMVDIYSFDKTEGIENLAEEIMAKYLYICGECEDRLKLMEDTSQTPNNEGSQQKERVSSLSPQQEEVSSLSPQQEEVSSLSPQQEEVSSFVPSTRISSLSLQKKEMLSVGRQSRSFSRTSSDSRSSRSDSRSSRSNSRSSRSDSRSESKSTSRATSPARVKSDSNENTRSRSTLE